MFSRLWQFPRRLAAQIRTAVNRRAAVWARKRQGPDAEITLLDSKRIYILPTGVGTTYAIAVFVMLLGAMNYNNSMAFVLTFYLAALGLIAMHHSHRNLAGTMVRFAGAEPVFAGDDATFRIAFENPSRSARYDLYAYLDKRYSASVDLQAGDATEVVLRRETAKRGWLHLERFGVRTLHPFGLFRAWSWLHTESRCLVWPAPATSAPPLPQAVEQSGSNNAVTAGDEDFAGLRNFELGDPPKHIAWKTLARTGELKSKRFAGASIAPRWFSLGDVSGHDLETGLSILARWVLDAEAAKMTYGLRLGSRTLAPDSGNHHRNRCLEQLALFELGA